MTTIPMKKLSYALTIMCTIVVFLVVHSAQTPINCTTVQENLAPCLPHLKSSGSTQPPAPCCAGVRLVRAGARTTDESRALCQCLRQIVGAIQGINYDQAARLAGQCGVSMSYTISPNTDCSKVTV